jgi:hypothetical protein
VKTGGAVMAPNTESLIERVRKHELMNEEELAELCLAVQAEDIQKIESIGHNWSGGIALDIFEIADAVEGSGL